MVAFVVFWKGGPAGQGGDPSQQQKAAEERQREVTDMKNSILSQVLDQSARARCKFISCSLELPCLD